MTWPRDGRPLRILTPSRHNLREITMTRWQRLLGLVMLALSGIAVATAADPYPVRPVRMIVGFAAGGPTDVLARVMAQWLGDRLGQQFVVDNRTGAGGNIATEAVIKAPPDGYTMLVIVTANVINPALFPNLPFNFLRDITGVAGLSRISYVVAIHPGLPVRNIAELVAHAKTNAGKITFASGGIGSSSHLSTEIFKGMPEVPTVAETVPGYEASAFYGFGVPRGTPPEIIEKLNATINAGHRDPKIKARFAELDAASIIATPSDFGAFMAAEAERRALPNRSLLRSIVSTHKRACLIE